MVPRVAKGGRSFKGAGLYYLHDKKARTRARVLFTMTVNLPTDDPDRALRLMAYTAMRQEEIKRAAGTHSRGRKLVNSVYSYSLSWAPDETPSHEEMIEAAFSTLEKLGMADHEAVLIAHDDTPHPHVHVIVNRVNPDTGLAAPLSKDHIVLSEWAEAYELLQGEIRIEQRVENNKKRRKQYMKDRESEDAAEYRRWQKARERAAEDARKRQQQQLTEQQKREVDQFERKAREQLDDTRKTQKEVQRADWADLYRLQKKERDAFEKAQQSPFGRLRYWLTNKDIDKLGGELEERQNKIQRAFQVLANGNIMRDAIAAKEVRERKELSTKLRALTEAKIAPIAEGHATARKSMDERHTIARGQQTAQHQKGRDERTRIAREGLDRPAFEFDQSAKKAPAQRPNQRSEEFTRYSARTRSYTKSRGRSEATADTEDVNKPSRKRAGAEDEFTRFSDRARGQAKTRTRSDAPADDQPDNKPSRKRGGLEESFTRFSGRGRSQSPDRGAPESTDEIVPTNEPSANVPDQNEEQLNIFRRRGRENEITKEPEQEPSPDSKDESPSDIFSRRGPNRGGPTRDE